jgi:hypothetical protein
MYVCKQRFETFKQNKISWEHFATDELIATRSGSGFINGSLEQTQAHSCMSSTQSLLYVFLADVGRA